MNEQKMLEDQVRQGGAGGRWVDRGDGRGPRTARSRTCPDPEVIGGRDRQDLNLRPRIYWLDFANACRPTVRQMSASSECMDAGIVTLTRLSTPCISSQSSQNDAPHSVCRSRLGATAGLARPHVPWP